MVDGKRMTKKTVLELDGTTKVFMVPFISNFSEYRTWQDFFRDEIQRVRATLLGGKAVSEGQERQVAPNPWLQPSF